jgi:hypothetical protein
LGLSTAEEKQRMKTSLLDIIQPLYMLCVLCHVTYEGYNSAVRPPSQELPDNSDVRPPSHELPDNFSFMVKLLAIPEYK